MVTAEHLTRLRDWARRRAALTALPPEVCVCEFGCSRCGAWLLANTIYCPPDPPAQRRRRVARTIDERDAWVPRTWGNAAAWLRAHDPLDDGGDTEAFSALRSLVDSMPVAR